MAGFTVAAWVKNPDVSDDVVSKWDSGASEGSYKLGFDSSGYADFRITSDGTTAKAATGAVDVSDDNWHFMAGVYNPSTYVRVYVDGVLVNENTSSIPSSIHDSYVPLMIGASLNSGSATANWNGEVYQPLLFAEALTDAEIKELFDVGFAQLNLPASAAAITGSSNQVNTLAFDEETEMLWAGTEDGATPLQTVNGWVAGAVDIDGAGTAWGYGDSRTEDGGNTLFQATNNDFNALAAVKGTVALGTESEVVLDTLDGKTVYEIAVEGTAALADLEPQEVIVAEWFVSGSLATGNQQGGRVSIKGSFDPTKLVCVLKTTGDTSGDTSIDLNADGASILYATVDITYNDSDGVGYTTEFDMTSYPFGLVDGTILDIDIDSIPGGTTSTDLRVVLYGVPREE